MSDNMGWMEWRSYAADRLSRSGDDLDPRREAELLLCHGLHLRREQLIIRRNEPLSQDQLVRLASLLERRAAGEPLAYLVGSKEFYGRDFMVSPATLVPRPETEHLIDAARVLASRASASELPFAEELGEALSRASLSGPQSCLDLGTGTGCIALTLAAECPDWNAVAVDISYEALTVAEANAKVLKLADRVRFLRADFSAEDFLSRLPQDFAPHLVISNPPYISEEEYAGLERGVRDFEPKRALVPGPSGLELPRKVVAVAEKLLPSGGVLLMEHGAAQGPSTRALCGEAWSVAVTGRDYAGKDRYLLAIRK